VGFPEKRGKGLDVFENWKYNEKKGKGKGLDFGREAL